MVGDPFQVGEQVRGQHDGQAACRHRLDQLGQEVPAGQRVEGGDRLVEQQQPGRLARVSASASSGWCADGRCASRPPLARASQRVPGGRRPLEIGPQNGGERLADVLHLLHLHEVGKAVGALQGRS